MASAVSFFSGSCVDAASRPRRAASAGDRALAAAFTASQMRIRDSIRASATPIFGLRMMSTAPASRAWSRVSDPASTSDEHITTGIGCWAISLRRKVMPSMRGISTSRVMTSGISSRMRLAATNGSEATPITSICGSDSSTAARVWRTVAESSMIRTRIFWTRL
jgi:hypothetical protein